MVVHRDRYDDTGLEPAVATYDTLAHARTPISPEKQRHPDKYGLLEKCTWSENVARQLSVTERGDFRAFLARRDIALE